MIRARTVFVVGAGASCEAGLPSGAELKRRIAELLDIRFRDGIQQQSGDRQIMAALWKAVEGPDRRRGDVNPLLHKARQIRDGMPLSLSIDNYLDAHRDDGVELCGKLAICKSILDAESFSKLYFNRNSRDRPGFEKVQDTWYIPFHQLLTEGLARGQIERIFENVSIINFNYDRCLEHFLYNAVQVYYGISEQEAAHLLSGLYIFRPYGTVGPLPWQRQGEQGVPFGVSENCDLLQISRQIKTFTERVEEGTKLNEARQRLAEAEVIVFLGFAFHPQNMRLLDADAKMGAERVYGTVKGVSGSDLDVIKRQISQLVGKSAADAGALTVANTHTPTVRLSLVDMTCSGLFQNYWRSLSQGSDVGVASRKRREFRVAAVDDNASSA